MTLWFLICVLIAASTSGSESYDNMYKYMYTTFVNTSTLYISMCACAMYTSSMKFRNLPPPTFLV